MTSRSDREDSDKRIVAATYMAALAAEMVSIARQHDLETLSYILDMARIEAESIVRRNHR